MIPSSPERTPTVRSTFARPAPLDSETRHPDRRFEDRELDVMTRVFTRTGGLVCADDIARLLRRHDHQPLSLLARWIVTRELVSVSANEQIFIPLFQFDLSSMTLPATLSAVLRELTPAFGEWDLALWFASPNAWLSNRAPAEVLWTDAALLLEAARADRFVAMG